jgi:hypothetical protein
MMDLLGTNKWERPVYISSTVPATQYKGLENFFVLEGMAYRVAPVKSGKPEPGEYGTMDPYVMYDNMMNKFKWGNAADPKVYLDENNRRMFVNFRRMFGTLGETLLQAGDTAKALAAVRKGMELVPTEKLPNDYFSLGFAEVLIRAGKTEEGLKLLNSITDYSVSYVDYIVRIKASQRFGLDYSTGINIQALLDIYNLSVKLKLDNVTKNLETLINKYYGQLYSR